MQHTITKDEMYQRTMLFSTRILHMVKAMPKGMAEDVIARQLIRSATSIGANYREACHGRSKSDFIAKIKICEGEADETLYWLELLVNSGIMKQSKMQQLIDEANELVAIFTASTKTARSSTYSPEPLAR